jgi:hypothetical protein
MGRRVDISDEEAAGIIQSFEETYLRDSEYNDRIQVTITCDAFIIESDEHSIDLWIVIQDGLDKKVYRKRERVWTEEQIREAEKKLSKARLVPKLDKDFYIEKHQASIKFLRDNLRHHLFLAALFLRDKASSYADKKVNKKNIAKADRARQEQYSRETAKLMRVPREPQKGSKSGRLGKKQAEGKASGKREERANKLRKAVYELTIVPSNHPEFTYEDIGRKIGIHKSTVSRWIDECGWTRDRLIKEAKKLQK